MLDLESTKGINQINANLKWYILMQRFSLPKVMNVNREMNKANTLYYYQNAHD